MRGDVVGAGHISEVQSGAGCAGIEAGGGDGRGAIGERDTGVVDRRAGGERDAGDQQAGIWSSISDGARDEHGEECIHRAGTGGADGMRGNGVGVGHISEVQSGAGRAGIETGSCDGRGEIWERDTGVVDGRAGGERGAGYQP